MRIVRICFSLLLVFLLVLSYSVSFAETTGTNEVTTGGGLQVTNMTTAEDLVARLLGDGVTVSNVSFKGVSSSAGTFRGGADIIGFEEGIILSTGSINNVVGPNINNAITAYNYQPGDLDLNTLIPGSLESQDATVLEFDFIPETDALAFHYVFASDEYNEFANSSFNDVFGFFLNGKNVALLPGTNTPVSINSVNGGKPYGTNAQNPEFYRNNDLSDGGGSINTEMDGLTVVLSVMAEVKANEVNHIKLAIADVNDSAYDSNVFIKAGSFTGKPKPGQLQFSSPTYSVNEDEGSISVEVTRTEGSYGSVTIDYSTSDGTAKNGVDYTSVTGTLSFGDGVTSQSFNIPIINNPTFQGDKTVNMTLSNPSGGAALGEPSTAVLTIIDNQMPDPIMAYVFIDKIADMVLNDSGHIQQVKGYVDFKTMDVYGSRGQLLMQRPLLYKIELFVNDAAAAEDSIIFRPEARSEKIRTNKTGKEFVLDWAIHAPGEYTLAVVATLRTGYPEDAYDSNNPQHFFTDYEDDIVVKVAVCQKKIYIEPMAAPAVAGKILKYNNVKPNQGKGKNSYNLISLVAQHMGPQTYFEDVPKSVLVNGVKVSNGYYWDEVLKFLRKKIPDLKIPTADWLEKNGSGTLYYE